MISVTYFALENIAMSKVDVHQDQGGQHEDGQGQVRSVRFQCVFSAPFQMKTIVTNVVYNFINVFVSF